MHWAGREASHLSSFTCRVRLAPIAGETWPRTPVTWLTGAIVIFMPAGSALALDIVLNTTGGATTPTGEVQVRQMSAARRYIHAAFLSKLVKCVASTRKNVLSVVIDSLL